MTENELVQELSEKTLRMDALFDLCEQRQKTIKELMQNTESMNQTNAALLKKLAKAVEALENSLAIMEANKDMQIAYRETIKQIRQTLAEINKGN